ncbi:MAG: TetR/AcrR family transcriptional regulator [Alphaproteobacteria bacterium]|nr:TetR/AcrR family transcriptional regulator [Alphaproteobacteria bacterium]
MNAGPPRPLAFTTSSRFFSSATFFIEIIRIGSVRLNNHSGRPRHAFCVVIASRQASRASAPRARPDIRAAYDLSSRDGIRATGIDAIIDGANVARMTFYRHFDSKNDLMLAFLAEHEQRWTIDWLKAEVFGRHKDPKACLLVVFDLLGEWFRQRRFNAVPSPGRCLRSRRDRRCTAPPPDTCPAFAASSSISRRRPASRMRAPSQRPGTC